MKTIATDIFRVLQAGETIFVSLTEVSEAEMADHYAREPGLALRIEPQAVDVPVVDSELVMWEGHTVDGVVDAPHLHFICPRCEREHCVDLYPEDANPRFGCCDTCAWESLVWIEWKHAEEKCLQGN